MKLKNHYVWICLLWIIITLCHSVSCVVNFVNENLGFGCLFLVLAVGFSFMSGVLFNKAKAIYHHNKQVDWLKEISKQLSEEEIQSIKPFEDFDDEGEN